MAETGLPAMNPQTGLLMTNLEWCFALGDYDDCITTTRERRTWLGDALSS